MKSAANVVSVQIAWFACAYGAVAGAPSVGVVSCIFALGLGLILTDQRSTLASLAGLLGLYGLTTESVLTAIGAVQYASPEPHPAFAPLWIVALWMAFSTLIYPTFGWLIDRPIAASILAAIMAPVSYLAADQVGALNLPRQSYLSLLGVALIWAIALPGAIHMRLILSRRYAGQARAKPRARFN